MNTLLIDNIDTCLYYLCTTHSTEVFQKRVTACLYNNATHSNDKSDNALSP